MSEMSEMKSVLISNKFNNLSILLLAKEEHKEKFWNEINCGDDGFMIRDAGLESIPYHIYQITYRKQQFDFSLRNLIDQKYRIYITQRKYITQQKYEYIPDECCPVCFDKYGIEDYNATITKGKNCNHNICRDCYKKIVDDTNKCPICRALLNNT